MSLAEIRHQTVVRHTGDGRRILRQDHGVVHTLLLQQGAEGLRRGVGVAHRPIIRLRGVEGDEPLAGALGLLFIASQVGVHVDEQSSVSHFLSPLRQKTLFLRIFGRPALGDLPEQPHPRRRKQRRQQSAEHAPCGHRTFQCQHDPQKDHKAAPRRRGDTAATWGLSSRLSAQRGRSPSCSLLILPVRPLRRRRLFYV